MNRRERLMKVLDHKEPDKVPLDFASTTVTSIGIGAYKNLLEYLKMEPEHSPVISHIHQGIVYPREDVLTHYDIDFRPVYMKKSPRGHVQQVLPDDCFLDEYGTVWKKGLYDYSPIKYPFIDYSMDDLKKVKWPDPYDPERVSGLKERTRKLYYETDYVIVGDIICRGPFETAVKLRGYEEFLMDMHLDPQFAETLLNDITENIIGLWDVYLNEIGNYAHVVCQGDDLGTQTALIISPEMYRKFIKPCHKRIYDFIHKRTNAKIFMHSCGSIYEIIPDLIEVGVDILNPIQRSAANMDIVTLKKNFGNDICFWGGGIDVQQVLLNASMDEIDEEIKRAFDVMAPGGGYVFALTHNVHIDVTSDRLNKAYEAAMKYRAY